MDKEKAVESLKNTWSITLKVIEDILFVFAILFILYPITEIILWVLEHIFPLIWAENFHYGWITDFASHWLPYIYHPKCNWFCFMMFNVVCIGISGFCANNDNMPLCGIFGVILVYFNFNPHLFETCIGWITALGIIICLGLGANGSDSADASSSPHTCGTAQQEKIIGYAVQRGPNVNVYDAKGILMFFEYGKLVGYTSQSVSIRRGNTIGIYDSKGHMQSWYNA